MAEAKSERRTARTARATPAPVGVGMLSWLQEVRDRSGKSCARDRCPRRVLRLEEKRSGWCCGGVKILEVTDESSKHVNSHRGY